MGRAKKSRPTIEEGNALLKQTFNKSYCLHPEANEKCKGNIVKAHTIQRNGGLSRIAVNNHVSKIFPVRDYENGETKYITKSIGIRKASTFTGFCSYHDNKIFEELEKKKFIPNDKQIFLLAYRTICRELFLKKCHQELLEILKNKDTGLPEWSQIQYQEWINAMIYGAKLGVETMKQQKQLYDEILLSQSFSKIRYYILFIDSTPEILCSGTHIPEIDFSGEFYPQLGKSDIKQEIMTFSIIPIETGGAIIFSTCDTGYVTRGFFKSLRNLSNNEIPDAIIRYSFEYFENVFFHPLWWESLNKKTQNGILDRASHGARPDSEHRHDYLKNDKFSYVNWMVKKRLDYYAC